MVIEMTTGRSQNLIDRKADVASGRMEAIGRALARWPLTQRMALAAWRANVSPWEIAGVALFVGLLAVSGPLAIGRMVQDRGSDFAAFYRAGRYVLEHGARAPHTILAYYWPSLDVAWAGLAWLPLRVAAVVWYAAGCAAWVGLLVTIRRKVLAGWPDHYARQAALAVGLLMMPLAVDHLCLGAFHILMLWLMIAGLADAIEGRWCRGGLLLGLAIWIKLLPGLAAGYLLLKRRWRPAWLAVASALAIDAALSVAAFGPSTAWAEHRQWWEKEVRGTTVRLLGKEYAIAEHRSNNQSLAAVMRRVLTVLVIEEANGRWEMYSLGRLTVDQLKMAYAAAMALMGAIMLILLWRPAWRMTPDRWPLEIALVSLSTIWFSPVVWSYHLLSIAPALALILLRERHERLAVWSLVGFWVAAMASLGSIDLRSYGALLVTSWVLGWAMLRLGRIGPEGSAQPLGDAPLARAA